MSVATLPSPTSLEKKTATSGLPDSWRWVKAAELLSFVTSGSRGWAKYYSDTGPLFLRIGNLDHDSISLDLSDMQRVQPPSGAEGLRTRVAPGDILISITADVGMVALVPAGIEEAYINQHVALARPKEGSFRPYVAWFLASPNAQRQFRELQRGATKVGLGLEDIRSVLVPLAPLDEQQRIVAEIEKQFTRLGAGVASLKRAQAALKRYRASVLKAACEGHLVPTEAELARRESRSYEPATTLLARTLEDRRNDWKGRGKYAEPAAPDVADLPVLPEGWCWASAEQACSTVASGSTPTADLLFAGSGEVPFIKVYNLTFGGALDFSVKPTFINRETHCGHLARSKAMPGDVLTNIVGPPLGKVSIVPDTFPEWNINQAIVVFRPTKALSNRLLAFWLRSEGVLTRLSRTAKATAGQFNIQVTTCRKVALPLPPVAEQARIVAEIERRMSVVDELEVVISANLQRAARLRQSVLHRAFSGGF